MLSLTECRLMLIALNVPRTQVFVLVNRSAQTCEVEVHRHDKHIMIPVYTCARVNMSGR